MAQAATAARRYRAFISYSHATDAKIAAALHRALHRFAKPWYRLRALRVFRDETNLSVTPGLWSSIEAALGRSDFMLLLASKQAAKSKWIAREVTYWLQHRSPDRLLILLTEGDLYWSDARADFDWDRTDALPSALRGQFAEEPLYVDFRDPRLGGDLSLRDPAFLDKVATIAAALHGRAKDELVGEDLRQQRSLKRLAWSASLALFVLAVSAGIAAFFAVQQQKLAEQRALEALARNLTAHSQLLALSTDPAALPTSLLLAVESLRRWPSPEANDALRRGLRQVALATRTRAPRAKGPSGLATTPARSDDVMALRKPSGHRAAAFSRDGTRLAIGTSVYDAVHGEKLGTLPRHLGSVQSVAFSADGKRMLSAALNGEVRILAVAGSAILREWNAESVLNQAVLAPDGSQFAVALQRDDVAGSGFDGAAVVDTQTGRELLRLPLPGGVVAIDFSPDGRRLAIAAGSAFGNTVSDRTARIVELPRGREVRRFSHLGDLQALAFSADGHYLATAVKSFKYDSVGSTEGEAAAAFETDDALYLWDTTNGALHQRIPVPRGVSALAFARSDGREYIAAGGRTGDTSVFALSDGALVARIAPHGQRSEVGALAFSPDGRLLVIVERGSDAHATLWRNADLIALACAAVTENLRYDEWVRVFGQSVPYAKTCASNPIHPSYVEAARARARAGELDAAARLLHHATELEPTLNIEVNELARSEGARGKLAKMLMLASSGDETSARAALGQARALDPTLDNREVAEMLSRRSMDLTYEERVPEALLIMKLVHELIPDFSFSEEQWNELCWAGSMSGTVSRVLHACDSAVRLAPSDGHVRDSRAVAYVLLGRREDALRDFQLAVAALAREWSPEELALRKQWIEELSNDRLPFDLASLRDLQETGAL